MWEKKKSLRIINYYGARHQLKKLSEEVYEFQESVIDYINSIEFFDEKGVYGDERLKAHLIEEYADVLVLLDQFKEYFKINGIDVKKIKNYKRTRTIERIKDFALIEEETIYERGTDDQV